MIRKMSKEEIEEFNRRYEAKKPKPHGLKPIKVTISGLGSMEFESHAACASHLKLSLSTITKALQAGGEYGDFYFEEF